MLGPRAPVAKPGYGLPFLRKALLPVSNLYQIFTFSLFSLYLFFIPLLWSIYISLHPFYTRRVK